LLKRRLGRSGIEVSALGLGTNGIGGVYWDPGFNADSPVGYGPIDEREAIRAIQKAVNLGINFFDSADEYGCGQSERLLGKALAGKRVSVVIATKFGYTFDEAERRVTGTDSSPTYVRRACEASLHRLNTDYIDLYQLHLRDLEIDRAAEVRDTLEDLVKSGKIRYYGWSTDDVERARFFAEGPHCSAVQHRLIIFLDNPEMLQLCEEYDLASINRIPLLMGILTGKHKDGVELSKEDIRSTFFQGEQVSREIDKAEQLRATLTQDGRTITQGALAWIWSRSPRTIPIPGFKTVKQVEENAVAMNFGTLSIPQMEDIALIMAK
jgi:aryl-alcohol dehydrogenase-like predicted oxidoreductase